MLPNFLIVGAARSGTTSMYYYLKEHPNIFMSPVKEINYFSINYSHYSIGYYENFFNKAIFENAIGEASPSYLWTEKTPERIKKHIPDCKIIIILRDPIDRFFSDHRYLWYNYKINDQICDILEEIKIYGVEQFLISSPLVKKGLYFHAVKSYLKQFGSSNIKVMLFDDLKHSLYKILNEVYSFLGVDDNFKPKIKVYNSRKEINTYSLKNVCLYNLSKKNYIEEKFEKLKRLVVRSISKEKYSNDLVYQKELHLYLKNIYKEDVVMTEDLIGRNLKHWKVFQ